MIFTKKIKILYTGYSSNMGGIERFLMNVCKNLNQEKFEICFLVSKEKKVCCQELLKDLGVIFFEVTDRNSNYQQYIKDLKKVYNENDFDIIHFNIMNFSLFERIALANKYSKARLLVHSHSSSINKVYKKTKWLDRIGRMVLRNINYERIACGKEAGEWLFGKKDFLILNNGMEVENFAFCLENRRKVREELGIGEEEKVIGHVGALLPVKNHEFLIKVFDEYQKINPKSKLLLVGEGCLREELEQQVKSLGIQEKVLFLGRRDDTEKFYSAMDVFVMPSWFEGFSVALMEAQVNGLKCYTSTNVAEESNVTGNLMFLALEAGSKGWAKEIYETNNVRDENAISKIPNRFKIEETVKVLSKIYEGE